MAARKRSRNNYIMKKAKVRTEVETNLSVQYISPKSVKENPKNSRKHPQYQVRLIEKSIRRYGFTSPLLLDKKGYIIAGHGRLMAARNLGLDSIPVIRLSLSGDKAREYLIADNAIPMLSKWDKGILRFELDELKTGIDIGDLGISASAFNVFGKRRQNTDKQQESAKSEKKPRKPKMHTCPKCLCVFTDDKNIDTRLTP